jgi:ribosomal protein S18 acetylase RimI-like enzyme
MRYVDSPESVSPHQLQGFFVGWPNPPSPEKHRELLEKSDVCLLAMDETTSMVVGFITAITDHVLSAYIPLLEVLPSYQGQGIGAELVRRMLEKLNNLYMIDLLCDLNLQPYYERFGMKPASGMFLRNYHQQSGA